MIRKLSWLVAVTAAVGAILGSGASAYSWLMPLRVVVDNEPIYFPDAKPYSDAQNRTQVPIRFVGEALGAKVHWNGDTEQAVFEKEATRIVLTIGKRQYEVNGQALMMDTEAAASNGRIFVPARYVAEALGAEVEWDAAVRTVYIWTNKVPKVKDEGNVQFYDGIAFNPETDIASNKSMKPEKMEEFTLNLVQHIKFVVEDGKYVIKGSYPELPEGYRWDVNIHVQRKDKLWFTLTDWETTDPRFDHIRKIPMTGSFSKEMPITSYDDVREIEIILHVLPEGKYITPNGYFFVTIREHDDYRRMAQYFNRWTYKYTDYSDRFPFDEMFQWP